MDANLGNWTAGPLSVAIAIMAGQSTDIEQFASINVVPLVDITLVLLIIMMVTAKIQSSQAVPILRLLLVSLVVISGAAAWLVLHLASPFETVRADPSKRAPADDALFRWAFRSIEQKTGDRPSAGMRTRLDERIGGLAWCPSGEYLAVAYGKQVSLFTATKWREAIRFDASGPVEALTFSPDGRLLAGAVEGIGETVVESDGTLRVGEGSDPAIVIWDVAEARTWTVLQHFDSCDDGTRALEFSDDGREIAATSWKKFVRVWDVESGRIQRTEPVFYTDGNVLALSHDWRRLLAEIPIDRSGHAPAGAVRLWDVARNAPVWTHRGHDRRVSHVALSRDGSSAASGACDGSVVLWAAEDGEDRWSSSVSGDVRALAFSSDGLELAAVGERETRIWDVNTGRTILDLDGCNASQVKFDPKGIRIAAAGQGSLCVWEWRSGKLEFRLKDDTKEEASHAIEKWMGTLFPAEELENRLLVSRPEHERACVWDVGLVPGRALFQVRKPIFHRCDPPIVVGDRSDKVVAVARYDGFELYQVATGSRIGVIPQVAHGERSARFSSNGQCFLVGDKGVISVWGVGEQTLLARIRPTRDNGAYVFALAGEAELLGGASPQDLVCRLGARVFPFEVCEHAVRVDGQFMQWLSCL